MNKRTLFIGDVHGCALELEKIIEAFGFVRAKDVLYQTGDVINKGPEILRAVQLVEELGILTVRGNHEEHLLNMLKIPESEWTDKQRMRFAKLSPDEWKYIASVVSKWPYVRDTEHALLVHAGLEPGQTNVNEMNKKVLLSVRLWNNKPWYEQVTWPKTVVFGHWARNGLVHRPGFIGLDSGCVYGKFLSAYCPEENRFYKIPAAREYAPVNVKKIDVPCALDSDYGEVPPKADSFLRQVAPPIAKEWNGYL